MNIIVCVKEILDPELTPEHFELDPNRKIALCPESVPHVLSPFDENAVEAALKIKDLQECVVTVLSLGNNLHREVVKKPLTMGADEIILLEDEAYEGGDSWSTAFALAQAIKRIGNYDMILCGRQAADWDAGQVGLGIAEMLNIPSISLAKKIEVLNGKALVERVCEGGYEIMEIALPALITVSNELGQPRYGTIEGVLASLAKEPILWKPKDLGIDASETGGAGQKQKLLRLYKPVYERECEIIEADDLEEAGTKLALRLRDVKLI